MKLRELLDGLEIKEINADPETEISGICYDSRKVKPGDLFVAICGFESDGHKYIPGAIRGGASAVLCEKKQSEDVPYICVDNSRKALALASKAFFGAPSDKMTVIGITGTNGKTTSSYLIKHMLEEITGKKVGLVGTNGNMIGHELLHSERTTPESYELQELFARMLSAGCEYVVMEVSSHSLVLDRVTGIRFAVSIYTNLTQDHLDFHKTMEEYARAKKSLFSVSDTACINIDDSWAGYMMDGEKCRLLTFSAESDASNLFADEVKLSAEGVEFKAKYSGAECDAFLCIPGMFSVHNALGMLAAGLALGFKLEQCCGALETAKGVKGRVEVVPVNKEYSVIIDYSHTPDSLENICKTLKPLTRGKLIALFGCGGDRDRLKRPIMGKIAADNADFCIVTSDNPRTEVPEKIIEDILEGMKDSNTPSVTIVDRVEAIHYGLDNARPGDVLLLAGKGHEDYQEIFHEKRHMDEREIVIDYLKTR